MNPSNTGNLVVCCSGSVAHAADQAGANKACLLRLRGDLWGKSSTRFRGLSSKNMDSTAFSRCAESPSTTNSETAGCRTACPNAQYCLSTAVWEGVSVRTLSTRLEPRIAGAGCRGLGLPTKRPNRDRTDCTGMPGLTLPFD